MRRTIACAANVLIVAVIITACGGAEMAESSAPEDISPPAPYAARATRLLQPGGALKIDSLNPKTFNPILNENESVDRVLRLIFEPLIALDENMKPAAAIASSWEFAPDGLAVTLRLRHGIFWEDGTEITAEDVKYTIETIFAAPETSLYKNCTANITGFSAVDEKTVRITYAKPFSGALYNLTFPVLPAHYYRGVQSSNTTVYPMGSGLYKLDEFNTMETVKLVRSNNCYRGQAQTEEIEAVIIRSSDTSLYAFEQKIIDMTTTNSTDWKRISAARPVYITKYPSQSYEFLALNFKNPVLYNVNVRKAIASVVPRETIIDKHYAGNMFKTDTPVNPQSWLYETDTDIYEYDIDKAREYLNMSNISSLGTVKILANDNNNERVLTAQLLAKELGQIGFVTELDITDFESYKTKLTAGNFDIAAAGFDLSLSPSFSQLFGSAGSYNFISFKDDLMDAYLSQAEAAIFESAQKSAYSNIQKLFAEQLPYISIGYKATAVLTGDNITGDITPSVNSPYYNIFGLTVSS